MSLAECLVSSGFDELCPECDSDNIIIDSSRGEFICADCGLVLEEQLIDHGRDWRAFTAREFSSRARTGPPVDVFNSNLSTIISYKNQDARGRKLSTKEKRRACVMRKWNERTKYDSSKQRNLREAVTELRRIGSVFDLSESVLERGLWIYRRALDADLIQGRSIDGVVAASIYSACRVLKVPYNLSTIASASLIEQKDVGKIYRVLVRELGLKPLPEEPVDYLNKYISNLGLSSKVYIKALQLLCFIKEKGFFNGSSPNSVCAGAVYIASIRFDEKRTQKEVANVGGVTEVTVRNRYQAIIEKLGINLTRR